MPRVTTISGYAKLRGVSKSTAYRWHRLGKLVMTPDGRVDIGATDDALAPSDAGGPASAVQAELRELRARVELLELKIKILKGDKT